MLLDPVTLDLAPVAARVPGAKLELLASQIELNTPPADTVGEAIAALAEGRHQAAGRRRWIACLGVAGVHLFAAPLGELNADDRHGKNISAEYGDVAWAPSSCAAAGARRRRVGRAASVYNALRGYLPELAALAANALFHAGTRHGRRRMRCFQLLKSAPVSH